MKENKKINEEELENVSGGEDLVDRIQCSKCNKYFTADYAESRKVGSGCDGYYEYKCPNCDTWNRF